MMDYEETCSTFSIPVPEYYNFGFDVVDAVVELTLGNLPHYKPTMGESKHIVNEFLYLFIHIVL